MGLGECGIEELSNFGTVDLWNGGSGIGVMSTVHGRRSTVHCRTGEGWKGGIVE